MFSDKLDLLRSTVYPEMMGLKSFTKVDSYYFEQKVFNAKITNNGNLFLSVNIFRNDGIEIIY
jgi:hypothetical protein